jgi:glycosyltransferase involved in cell wall biosynthesis
VENVFICVKDMEKQFNQLLLNVLLFLFNGNNKAFLDQDGREYHFNRNKFILKILPKTVFYILYIIIINILLFIIAVIVRVILKLNGEVKPKSKNTNNLCYLKTDFWQGLLAGGSVTHTKGLINAGVDLGYKISVLSLDRLEHFGLRCPVKQIPPANILYQYPQYLSQLEYNFRFFINVVKILKNKKPDLLYIRNPVNNFSAVLLSIYLKIPLVLEFNSSSVWISKNWRKSRPNYFTKIAEEINLMGAWRINVVSGVLKNKLVENGISPDKIAINPNGVDLTQFNPHIDPGDVRKILPQDRILIGFIGIFGQWHGVITLARSVKLVTEVCPKAHFVIIGGGSLRKEMEDITLKDRVENNVTFVGTIIHDDAPRYLQCCDILVSPHEDMADGSPFFGSPTKIFEYMAMGKAIVTTSVGQLEEIFRNGENALVVEQKNPKALADSIIRLIRDKYLCNKIASRAFEDVSKGFTWKHNFLRAIGER